MKIMLKDAKRRYVTDSRGNKRAVIVPLPEYRRLMEDLHDLVVVAERRQEPPISFEQMRRRLKSRDLL
jgi:PHD/YefM family antitoxin component YafN of YafNO toxin-antitoxin module